MPLFHVFVLAVVQGITEFLPISSSAHLILVPKVTGWPDQGLTIDVAVHVGTLGAVVAYLWRDVAALTGGAVKLATGKRDETTRLFVYLVIATIPVVVAGLAVKELAGDALRSFAVIGWSTVVFGVVLYLADRFGATLRRVEDLRIGSVLFIGVAQAVALIPGTSRSGITITAARMLGYDRRESARFSMLMSIPTIVAAGALSSLDLIKAGETLRLDAALAVALSFVTALGAIAVMMRWLRRATYMPFIVYRMLLGVVILGWLYLIEPGGTVAYVLGLFQAA